MVAHCSTYEVNGAGLLCWKSKSQQQQQKPAAADSTWALAIMQLLLLHMPSKQAAPHHPAQSQGCTEAQHMQMAEIYWMSTTSARASSRKVQRAALSFSHHIITPARLESKLTPVTSSCCSVTFEGPALFLKRSEGVAVDAEFHAQSSSSEALHSMGMGPLGLCSQQAVGTR